MESLDIPELPELFASLLNNSTHVWRDSWRACWDEFEGFTGVGTTEFTGTTAKSLAATPEFDGTTLISFTTPALLTIPELEGEEPGSRLGDAPNLENDVPELVGDNPGSEQIEEFGEASGSDWTARTVGGRSRGVIGGDEDSFVGLFS